MLDRQKALLSVTLVLRAAIAALFLVVLAWPSEAAAARPQVTKVVLHHDSHGHSWPTFVRLNTRDASADDGNDVLASRGIQPPAFAKEVRHGRWRITPGTKTGRDLISGLRRRLRKEGAARLFAGVLDDGPRGGKGSDFVIRGYNEPAHPLRRQD